MLFDTNKLFLISVGLFLAGGLLSLFTQKRAGLNIKLTFSFSSLGSLAGILSALSSLLTGSSMKIDLWSVLDTHLYFTAGPLAAFFILIITMVSLAVSIFSLGYVTEYIGKNNVGILGLLFNLFLLSMLGVIASGNSLMFLFFWELMSLVSYFLVVYEHQKSQVRRAGFIYLVMTHLGTIFIMLAFLILYREAGSFNFSQYALVGHKLAPGLKTIIFLMVTLGFGTKAGIIPLHIWLPKAHPAAPSNVSAVMSGVMLKTAIFGLIKVVLEILGGGPAWWGILIVIIGCISALLGVMYALLEHDIKRLLAYSSVENIGIILLGIGASLIFVSYGKSSLAILALVAGLFHAFNHAIFKSLLFMGAGSIHYATHTRDIELMGGLLKKMPQTGLLFLIGSVSISALPPFNGFVGEWLTFQSLLALGSTHNTLLNILGPLAGAALALTGALAAACFVNAFGIQFLALPRSDKAENATEVPLSMRFGMGLMALLCIAFGLLPMAVFRIIAPITQSLLGTDSVMNFSGFQWLKVHWSSGGTNSLTPLLIFAMLAVVGFVIFLLVRNIGQGGQVRLDETWNCGTELSSRMEYSATSFSKPIRIIFRKIFQPNSEIKKEYKSAPYFPENMEYKGSIKPIFEDTLYRPTTKFFISFSNKLRKLQSGSVHLYLAYIFVTLVIMLLFAR